MQNFIIKKVSGKQNNEIHSMVKKVCEKCNKTGLALLDLDNIVLA
jgi:hypothetical protein